MATAAGIPDHSTASSARTSNIMENCWDASAWVQTDTRRESPESESGEFSGDHAMEWVFKSPQWDWDNLMLFPGRGREVDRRLLSTDCSFPSSALQAPVSEEYGQKQSMDQGLGSSESRGTKGKENGESELGNCRKWVNHKPFGAESGQEQRTLASADQLESCSLSSGYNSCVLGSLGQGEKRDQLKTQLKYSAKDHPQSLSLGFGGKLEIKKQVRRDEEMQSKEMKKEMNSTDSLISLKLGKQDFFEDHSGHVIGKAASVSTCPSPSLPAKKQRVQSQAAQIPRCQVQGCNLDLSSVKEYHRKHKVCEAHSKFPRVVVAGLEQRFCQQCSRFQVLNEFDEGKRSCRRRLAGHNERRRKQPQPETMTIAVAGNVSSFQDNGSWSYGNGSWSRLQNLDDQHRFSGNLKIPGSERQLFNSALSVSNADRLLMLLQNSKRNMISMSNNADNEGNNPFLKSKMEHALSLTSTPGADILAGMAPTQGSHNFTGLVDSGCALSLLSSESWDGKSPSSVSSFNFSGRSHAPFEQLMVESTVLSQPQHMLLGSTRDTQPDDFLTKDLLSKQVQFPGHLGARHNLPPSIKNHMEKESPQGSCISAALGHYPMLSLVHGQEYKSSQQVGTMLNLMQGPASGWQSAQPSSESGQLQSLSPPRPF